MSENDPFTLAWEGEHDYNNPGLTSLEFLTAVYQDTTVPINLRIEAAFQLLPYTEKRPGTLRQPTITVKLPFLPRDFDPIVEQDKDPIQ